MFHGKEVEPECRCSGGRGRINDKKQVNETIQIRRTHGASKMVIEQKRDRGMRQVGNYEVKHWGTHARNKG